MTCNQNHENKINLKKADGRIIIIQIRAEVNEIEDRKTLKINGTANRFLEKIMIMTYM